MLKLTIILLCVVVVVTSISSCHVEMASHNVSETMEALQKENEELKKELERYRNPEPHSKKGPKEVGDDSHHVSIVVLGGSGDLAKKKTFPTLFALHCLGLLPKNYHIWGYSRTKMDDAEFRKDHVGVKYCADIISD